MQGEPIWVSVTGGELPVWEAGSGPLLLLVHGWTLDARIWRPQVDGLKSRYRVATFDRRGFGRATAPPDLAAEVDDLVRVLDALKETQAVVVAMSQGARSAIALAALHPERVRGLVLVGAPYPFAPPGDIAPEPTPIDAMRALARAGDLPALRAMWLADPLLDLPGGSDAARDLLSLIVGEYRARDLLIEQPLPVIGREALAAIQVPTHLFTGEWDSTLRHRASALLAATIPGAREESVAGAGHLCSLSHPEAFNRALAGFVDQL